MLRFFKSSDRSKGTSASWSVVESRDAILVTQKSAGRSISYEFIEPYITQLLDKGFGVRTEGGFLLDWEDFYIAAASADFNDLDSTRNL